MQMFGISRALRTVVVTLGMVSFAPATGFAAGALISPGTLRSMERSAEPFGLLVLTAGDLQEKWLAAQRRLDDDMVQLALCGGDRIRVFWDVSLAVRRSWRWRSFADRLVLGSASIRKGFRLSLDEFWGSGQYAWLLPLSRA